MYKAQKVWYNICIVKTKPIMKLRKDKESQAEEALLMIVIALAIAIGGGLVCACASLIYNSVS